MKKSQEIVNSPVISIADGTQIGSIKGLVINPQQKSVEFLLLDEQGSGQKLRGLPFLAAEGFGEYAITVENENVIIDTLKVGALTELVQQGVNVIGKKVITKKGKYLGDVTEFSLDISSGSLAEIYYKAEGEAEKSISAQNVLTIGKEVIIVEEMVSATAPSATGEGEALRGTEPSSNFKQGDESSQDGEVDSQQLATEEKPAAADISKQDPAPSEKSELDPADIFIQRQRQHIIGKALLKDLKSDTGEMIAWENEVVTEELFNRVYQLGAQKLMELAMSVRES